MTICYIKREKIKKPQFLTLWFFQFYFLLWKGFMYYISAPLLICISSNNYFQGWAYSLVLKTSPIYSFEIF